MPVGEVTLISVRYGPMTSMPVNRSPRFFSCGPSRAQISSSRFVSLVGLRRAADVQVRARLARRRHAIDGARHLAVDEDDALVALSHLGAVLLHHERLAEHALEQLDERTGVGIVLADAEDGGAAVAVQRLQDDVAHLLAERLHVIEPSA